MQSMRILQAAALLLLVAMAASCASTREYAGKLFAPREAQPKDSSLQAIRFMETGDAEQNTDDWVSTDIIMGRDSSGSTSSLDQLARTFPAGTNPEKSIVKKDSSNTGTAIKDTALVKTTPVVQEEPAVKSVTLNGKRNKKSRDD